MESIATWLIVAFTLSVLLFLLAGIARRIILKNINVVEEVDQQHNKGVAFMEAAIFLAIGLLLKPLLG